MFVLFLQQLTLQNITFSECGCVMESLIANMNSSMGSAMNNIQATAVNSACESSTQCNLLAAFLLPIGLALILQYSRAVPLVYITIRLVFAMILSI